MAKDGTYYRLQVILKPKVVNILCIYTVIRMIVDYKNVYIYYCVYTWPFKYFFLCMSTAKYWRSFF